ncbi:MAG: ribonuclease P protein component [Nitrososphaerales archaeon]
MPRAVGKSVLRNRIRRRLREIFRTHRESIKGGWDIVLNPRRAVAEVPFTTLTREMLRLLQSAPEGKSPESSS